jgi:hypothetical protein
MTGVDGEPGAGATTTVDGALGAVGVTVVSQALPTAAPNNNTRSGNRRGIRLSRMKGL